VYSSDMQLQWTVSSFSHVLPSHPRLLLVNQMVHVQRVLACDRRLNVHVGAEKTTGPQVAYVVQSIHSFCYAFKNDN